MTPGTSDSGSLPADLRQSADAPLLGIVIVTFNSRDHLEACFHGWLNRPDVAVLVVDNASTDDTASLALGLGAEVVARPENGGFASAANLGLRTLLARGCPWVLILNPDTAATEDDCVALLTQLRALEPAASVVVPVGSGALRPYPTVGTLVRLMFWPGYPQREATAEPAADALDSHYIVGFFLLLSRDVWTRLAGLDESYFLYAEDAELSLRMRKVPGLRVVPTTAAVAHTGNRRLEDLPISQVDAFLVSVERFNGSGLSGRVAVPLTLGVGYLLRALASLMSGRRERSRRQLSVARAAFNRIGPRRCQTAVPAPQR